MSRPQIQYAPIAEPPAFTLPTAPTMGWRPSYPSGREVRRSSVHPSQVPTGATVFAVEQWTTSKGQDFEGPDTVRPFTARRLSPALIPAFTGDTLRALTSAQTLGWAAETPTDPRFGRRALAWIAPVETVDSSTDPLSVTPFAVCTGPEDPRQGRRAEGRRGEWTFADSASEPWVVTPGAGFTGPETPQQLIHRAVMRPAVFREWLAYDAAAEPWTVTPGAGCELPDVPAQFIARRLREYPAFAETLALEQGTVPPNSWTPTYPDRPVRARAIVEYPALSLTLSLEQNAVPSLSWSPRFIDRADRAKRLTDYPSLTLTQGLERWTIPPNSWQPTFVDRTTRAKSLIEHPACIWPSVSITVVPAPANSWTPQIRDRVWAAARLREYPALSTTLGAPFAVIVGFLPSLPDRVAPPARRLQSDPAQVFGLEQFSIPPASWLPTMPDRLVRAKTLPVYPASSATSAPEPWPVTLWQPVAPDRLILRVRVSPEGGIVLAPVQGAPVSAIGSAEIPVRRALRRLQTEAVQNVLPQGNQTVTALSWQGRAPERVWRLILPTAHQQALAFVRDLARGRVLAQAYSFTTARSALSTSTTLRGTLSSSATTRSALSTSTTARGSLSSSATRRDSLTSWDSTE